jgi:hypothetical protein
MSLTPVAASRLRGRAVQLSDRCLPEASLFPLFDRSGKVSRVFMITPESSEIFALVWRARLVHAPIRKPVRIAMRWTELRSVTDLLAARLADLWHFDPWWVLNEEPYVAHRMAPQLRATNCVGRATRRIVMLLFERDLSKATYYKKRKTYPLNNSVAWQENLLPARPDDITEPVVLKRRPGGWVLNPIWKRSWTR